MGSVLWTTEFCHQVRDSRPGTGLRGCPLCLVSHPAFLAVAVIADPVENLKELKAEGNFSRGDMHTLHTSLESFWTSRPHPGLWAKVSYFKNQMWLVEVNTVTLLRRFNVFFKNKLVYPLLSKLKGNHPLFNHSQVTFRVLGIKKPHNQEWQENQTSAKWLSNISHFLDCVCVCADVCCHIGKTKMLAQNQKGTW